MVKLVDLGRRPTFWIMEIDAPAERVWPLFSDFKAINEWWPDEGARIDFIGRGLGMIRNIYPTSGGVMCQRLEGINESQMEVRSSLMNAEEFGWKYIDLGIRVEPVSENRCRVIYSAAAEAIVPDQHNHMVEQFEQYLDILLAGLKRHLARQNITSSGLSQAHTPAKVTSDS